MPKDRAFKNKYKFLSKEDIKKLLNQTKAKKIIIYIFALFTRIRKCEILALKHKDIDLKYKNIKVYKTVRF